MISIRIIAYSPGLDSWNAFTASSPFSTRFTFIPISSRINLRISELRLLSSAASTRIPLRVTILSGIFSALSLIALSIGNVRSQENFVPISSSLSTRISPPISSMIRFTIESPRPVPLNSLRFSPCSCVNGSNICFWKSSLIPIPVSVTENLHVTLSSVCSSTIA